MKVRVFSVGLLILFFAGIIWAKVLVGLHESSNGYTLDFEVPQYKIEVVDTLGLANRPGYAAETFARIKVAGYKSLKELGKPQLPVFTFYIAITSPDQVPVFEVLHPVKESFPLKDRYFPAQTPWLKSQSVLDRRFDIDDAYYNSPGKREVLASVDEVFSIRGVPCVRVKISPFSYNPIENKVTAIKKFTLKINTATTPRYSGLDSKVFEKFLRYMVVNFESAVEPFRKNNLKEDYHIITGPDFESGLSEFVDFRKNRFNVTLATTDQAGTSTSAIESYIKGLNPTPAYLLLVGDTDDIPSKGDPATDVYYGSTDSDYYPEIFCSRFSVSSSSDLSNIIAKTIFMETNLGLIAKKNIFIGGVDAGSGHIAEETHNYCIDTYADDAGYQNTKFYENSSSVSKSEVTDSINGGLIFMFYSGHGGESGWGMSGSSDMKNYTNSTSYPFTYGFACATGSYHKSECFTEAAIRAECGAVACIGASTSSNWGGDDDMQRGIFDAMFDDNDPQTSAAASFNAGKVEANSSSYWKMYNLMGDPALEHFPINLNPFISVSSPVGAEKWEQGTTQEIKWGDNIDGNVKIELFKGGSLKETLAASVGSTGTFEWQIAGNYEVGDDYKVKITSIDSTALFAESAENFSIIPEYIVVCPYFQNFDTLAAKTEVLPFKYEQLADDDLNWTVYNGPTPSRIDDPPDVTGPKTDHTTGSDQGNYLYTEASSSNSGSPNKKFAFVTPKFNFKGVTSPRLSFWYHMFSDNAGEDHMGDLMVDISVDGTWQNDVIKISGNKGDNWLEQTLDLTPYMGDRVIFRFRGVTGDSWESDICIDDIKIDGAIPITNSITKVPVSYDLKYTGSRICFQVPNNSSNSTFMTLKLYNLQGKLVSTLVNGNVKAGYHSLSLGKALDGEKSPAAGLYLCTMKAGKFTKTINMIVRK